MHISYQDSQILVIDDFLGEKNREEVWKFMQAIAYSRMDALNWSGAWRLDDGGVMRGATYSYGELKESIPYPADQPIDKVFEAIFKLSETEANRFGVKDKDWKAMSAIPMLYPRGSSLYWHRDAESWTGSFTYYCHPEWNIHWGGELLVANTQKANEIPAEYGVFMQEPRKLQGLKAPASFGAHLDTKTPNRLLMEDARGLFFQAKPDRVIILSQGVPHSVSKVHDAAGDHVRASISGFFLRK